MLIGAGIGIGGIKALAKKYPTLFKTENGGVKAGAFIDNDSSPLNKALDDIVANKNTQHKYIPMGSTPKIFQDVGMPNARVTINTKVIQKVMGGKHNVTKEQLQSLPQELNNPIAIAKASANSSNPNGYVVLTSMLENVKNKDLPIITALHIKNTKNGLEVVNVASVYGKNLGGLQKILHNTLYVNKEKWATFNKAFGLQLPSKVAHVKNNPSDEIIANQNLSDHKKLYATHRTTFEDLHKMLDSGVLPAPSYAISKNSKTTEKFGDIIIVPKENHIDPKRGASVYGGDAWTPRIKFNPDETIEVADLKAPILKKRPQLKNIVKQARNGDDFYDLMFNDYPTYQWLEKQAGKDGDFYELAQKIQEQVFKKQSPSIDSKIEQIKQMVQKNGGDLRGLEDAFTPEFVYKYKQYFSLEDMAKRGKELKTFKNKDKFYEEASKALKKDIQPPADYMEAKRLDKVRLDDVSRIIVPNEKYDEVAKMFKDRGIEVPIIRQRKNESSNSAIKRSSDGSSQYIYSSPTVGGAIYGGLSGMGVDYNQDGKNNLTDILIGAGLGAGGTKLATNTKMIGSVKDATSDFIAKKILDTDTADRIFGHKIYGKKAYMKYRNDMISSKNAKDSDYELLHNQLKTLDEQTRTDMHRYMNGDKSVKLTPNIKALADNYINKINQDSNELVDLGVLDKATAEKFKDRYIRRVYASKLQTQKGNTKGKKIASIHQRGRSWSGDEEEYLEYLKSGRERGIRTPGGVTLNGFQDRRIQPSSAISRILKKLICLFFNVRCTLIDLFNRPIFRIFAILFYSIPSCTSR